MHLTLVRLKKVRRRILVIIAALIVTAFAITQCGPIVETMSMLDEKESFTVELENLLNNRSKVFLTGEYNKLTDYYDNTQKLGKWAWEHEIRRIKYLRDWSKDRNIVFNKIESKVKIRKITKVGDNRYKISFDEVYRFDYSYKDVETPVVNSFGVRLIHVCELMKSNDSWKFYKDWYLDCFNDAVSGYNAVIPSENISTEFDASEVPTINARKPYNREQAVAYADKYSAVSWANGGSEGYNKKYRNYNGIGGDCTNYVSQCLGDKEAGNLGFDGTWYCHYQRHGNSMGSAAWLNAAKFKNYLLYSGKGKQIAKGNYKKLSALYATNNGTASTSALMLGDIISYEEKGKVVHNAIVTGFDSHGYPLVNTHTVDRYKVPWDLGWSDRDIQFFFIHIR